MEGEDDLDERPVFDPGEVVHSDNGDFSYRIEDLVGEGRCCLVYSAHSVRDNSKVALKAYKKGSTYQGALQRELYILELLKEPQHNVVTCFGHFTFKGVHLQVMELMESNVRQIIFKNDRKGLSPWAVQKFAKDILISLEALHSRLFVHGDLKPANLMWSNTDGAYKALDFGLTFHTDEADVHQIQTKGYQAPEAAEWNAYKTESRQKRRRRLQGTYCNLTSPAVYQDSLNTIPSTSSISSSVRNSSAKIDNWPSESSGVFTASEQSPLPHDKSNDTTKCSTSDLSEASTPVMAPKNESTVNKRHSTIFTGDTAAAATSSNSSGAEWRRGRKQQRCASPTRMRAPQKPGTAVDMWSMGCLLFEVITGSKLFRSGDKLTSVLKPQQLVDMKIGETEIVYSERGQSDVFEELKDLLKRCLADDPSERLTAEGGLRHAFLQRDLKPTVSDLVIMPTRVVMLMDVLKKDDEAAEEEVLSDIRSEASKFGRISSVTSCGRGHIYVEFDEASASERAQRAITGKRTFDERTVIAVFYPPNLLRQKAFFAPPAAKD